MEKEVRCHWHYMRPAWGRVVTGKPTPERDVDCLSPIVEPTEGNELVDPVRQAGRSERETNVVLVLLQNAPPTST